MLSVFLRKTAKGVLLTLKSIQFLFRPCLFCSPFFDSIETWKIVSWKAKFFKIYVDWISIDRGQLFFCLFFVFENLSPKEKLIVHKSYGEKRALRPGLLSVSKLGQSVEVHYHSGKMGVFWLDHSWKKSNFNINLMNDDF